MHFLPSVSIGKRTNNYLRRKAPNYTAYRYNSVEMADQNRDTGDEIAAFQPAIEITAKEPAIDHLVQQRPELMDSIEEPRVRTKLQLYAVLVSLCV